MFAAGIPEFFLFFRSNENVDFFTEIEFQCSAMRAVSKVLVMNIISRTSNEIIFRVVMNYFISMFRKTYGKVSALGAVWRLSASFAIKVEGNEKSFNFLA